MVSRMITKLIFSSVSCLLVLDVTLIIDLLLTSFWSFKLGYISKLHALEEWPQVKTQIMIRYQISHIEWASHHEYYPNMNTKIIMETQRDSISCSSILMHFFGIIVILY